MRFLIVDDEAFFQLFLKDIIHKNIPQAEIFTAYNGKAALGIVERHKPDIIIADLKMPIMDGMELVAAVKSKYPEIRIIIMSGYGEFNLVKEAFKLGVQEYFLKSELNQDEFLKAIKKVSIRLDSTSDHVLKEDLYLFHDEIKIKQLKRMLLHNLAFHAEELELCRATGLNFTNKNVVCLKLIVNNYMRELEEFSGKENLFQYAFLNIVQEFFCKHEICADILPEDPYTYSVFVCLDAPEGYYVAIKALFNAMKEMIYTCIGAVISGGVSELRPSLRASSELARIHETAGKALERFFITGCGTINRMDAEDDGNTSGFTAQTPIIKKIFANADFSNLVNDMQALRLDVKLLKFSDVPKVKKAFYVYYCIIMGVINEKGLNGDLHRILEEYENTVKRFGDLSAYNAWLERMIQAYVNRLCESVSPVERTKRYIDQNYSKNIFLSVIADEVGISKNYLSKLFVREMRMSINEYITNVRIEKAKWLMQTTNLKIYEVSEQIGFANVEYFSRIFKKKTGKSPKQYVDHVKTILDGVGRQDDR